MKQALCAWVCIFLMAVVACGSSSSSTGSNSAAAEYATFGHTLATVVPAGLKAGGSNANLSAPLAKNLSGECLASYTSCPNITASGGGDSNAGEILMRLWGLDYNSECTTARLADGTCFNCVDCQTSSVGTTNFIKPTLYAAPTTCTSISTSVGHYVNMGVDPCFFDNVIGQISNIATCKTVRGGAVNIATAVPWYASWGIPATVNFSSYYARDSGGGIWWTVNNGGTVGNQQYFFSLDSNWLYVGFKNVDTDKFLFLGTGSPVYYSARGEGSGVNISAYAGPVTGIPAEFEAIQVRVQSEKYIERMKSNGTYLWYQKWSSSDFPALPADVYGHKNSPTDNRCLLIGTSVVTSKYVPLADCVNSFGKASVTELNQDDNFTLKVIDQQTASAVSFSTALTPTTTTSCLQDTTSPQ